MKKDKVKQEWDEHRASIVKECAIWENLRRRKAVRNDKF